MREVLFKGKETGNGEWIEGNLFLPDEGRDAPTQICIGTDVVRITYNIDPDTVSEFTGKFDIRRKSIFENDIVEEAGGHRSVVKYSEEEAKFVLESKYVVTELGNKQVTVIGNIFDNADLMEI